MPRSAALLTATALLLLAACASPQERCISRATAPVRNLQGLLDEVNANLTRGYAYESYQVSVPSWEVCGYDTFRRPDGTIVRRPDMCWDEETVTRRREVPIDPAAEKRKRDALIAKITELRPKMEADIAACRAAYPDKPPAAAPVTPAP